MKNYYNNEYLLWYRKMIHTPTFPLQLGDRSLFEKADTVKKVVFFHLKNLLLTYPFEKISDPNWKPDYGPKKYDKHIYDQF